MTNTDVSCSICGSIGLQDISICLNHFVCSPECLELWKSQNCSCLDCSDLPEYITSTPQTTCEEPSTLELSPDDVSSNSIHLPQTLLVIINAHLLQRLEKEPLEMNHEPVFPQVLSKLPVFFSLVGHVSQRFLQTVLPAVKFFVESNTFHMLPRDLRQFSAITSAIGAKRQSVCLFATDSVEDLIPLECSHMVTHLLLKKLRTFSQFRAVFDRPFLVFPRLKRLTINSNHCGNSLFAYLMSDFAVEALNVFIVSTDQVNSDNTLAEVFSTNTRLRKVSLNCENLDNYYRNNNSRLPSLIHAISSNHSIQEVALFWLSSISDFDSDGIVPLLTSSSLRSFKCPGLQLNSNYFSALVNNRSLRTATFIRNSFNSNDLVTVLNSNRNLKRFEPQELFM
ncbi:hypothetical protein GEMRC1_014006 [Eukaryota sp. GEM-RC1]